MSEPCYQVVYLSRARHRMSDEELNELCHRSVQNNKRDAITGLLAYDGTRFLQAIEGPEAKIEALLGRICDDIRHDSIDIVARKSVPAREFGNWSMRIKRAEPGTCSREFLHKIKNDAQLITDPALQAIFIGFAFLGCRPFDRSTAETVA